MCVVSSDRSKGIFCPKPGGEPTLSGHLCPVEIALVAAETVCFILPQELFKLERFMVVECCRTESIDVTVHESHLTRFPLSDLVASIDVVWHCVGIIGDTTRDWWFRKGQGRLDQSTRPRGL